MKQNEHARAVEEAFAAGDLEALERLWTERQAEVRQRGAFVVVRGGRAWTGDGTWGPRGRAVHFDRAGAVRTARLYGGEARAA